MPKYITIFFLVLFPLLSFGQELKIPETITDIAEELANDDTDPEAVAVYIEKLYELLENPVKINSPDVNEISRLFFLSDFQVKALADYAHTSGKIVSVYELQNIPGFDKETAMLMIPFISIEDKVMAHSGPVRLRNTSITNFSIKSGDNNPSFLGPACKILTKYKFTATGLSGGMVLEKDTGEKFFTGQPPLPDFLSFNLAYKGNGAIRKMILGDYSARFGQGTNINTNTRFGLSPSATGYLSSRNEINSYTSTDENNFLRGVAAEVSVKNSDLFLFYSKNNIDATLCSSESSGNYVENFYKAGVHNTYSLLLKKDAVSDITYGLNFSHNFNNVRIGLTWSEDRLSVPAIPDEDDPKKIFDFKGSHNTLYSFYYNYSFKRILFYGEFSANEHKQHAMVQGLSLRPSDRLTINFLYRNYSKGYTAFHGKGPGSSSSTNNEQGALFNFTFEAARNLFISGGCDNQYFPWLKYRCSTPSWGNRKEVKIRYLPVEKVSVDASYSYRLSMVDSSGNNGFPQQQKIITRSAKVSLLYSPSDNLALGTRIDYKVAYPLKSKGVLLLQDINYRFRHIPVGLWFRYCLFDTDDWNSRVYTYENDLLYSFSVPALSGEGNRSYIMAKWEIRDKAELRVKYGATTKININNSENINELKVQLKLMF